ncbi:MAG: UDP-3-O-acyl-N-acetylglucosamine deacetylase [Gemmatimonadetes bacterium]|nr:UDP-3-O-acyl-N-acetylglucosamine deacetylase [Gemmatimonadota bacterium]MCY3944464.1 UDP-3-O-acyl-N-acetylglucosamine deacetylase [Gemmatimonadota bacterium]
MTQLRLQQTVTEEVSFEGVGIHTGESATLTVRPAAPGTGIVFVRSDSPARGRIPARLENVSGTELGTTLATDGVEVLTVEHILAALYACEIDNARVELDGREVPILDGSFEPYVRALDRVGLERQEESVEIVEVAEAFAEDGVGESSYTALPAEAFLVSATIEFAHPAIGRQHGGFAIEDGGFRRDIASARTFGFRNDVDALRERGFARGASLGNSVVLGSGEVVGGDLRYRDEFLRHKVGDLVGDLSLIGARLRGHIVAERPSHAGNIALARAVRERHDRHRRARRLDIAEILDALPHRYPLLLVDRVVDFEPNRRIVGLKNVTINEPFFRGHFPGHPIMPGVLVVEAMGQVGGLLLMDAVENPKDKVVYFMALRSVKWRRPVTPGDQILFEVEMVSFRRGVCKMRGRGTVEGRVVAEAEMMARVMDR